jgi:hypothetical protein
VVALFHTPTLKEALAMPLITRRSSARSTPRTFVGKCGSIRDHCSSLSQNRFLLMNPSPNTNQYRIVEAEELMVMSQFEIECRYFCWP